MATTIHTSRLSKHFGQTVAVAGVDLDIPAESLFFLLGPSGCGKTTLLRMIAGFTEPTSGAIRFGDRDITYLNANKRNAGMVFQSYALWPHMTVAQNVAFGLTVRKVSAADRARRVDEALATVQMRDYAHRKPNELSGGQQQRVALARAMVIEPTVLLLDEPLSNLDAKLRLEMRSQIKQICKESRITAVYVTHDQKEALSMADVMAVLRDGAVQQVGPPRQVYDRPCNRFVADFLGETNFLPARVAGKDGDHILLDCPAGRLRSAAVSAAADDLGNGVSVTCSIRPEAARLLDDATPADAFAGNCLAAQRLETVYLGEMTRHHLLLAGGLQFKAFELNTGIPRGPVRSATPRIGFDPQDVVVLRD